MIKGSGFGKLLKQFFIIGLISCFGFGVNSFVNAGYCRDVGVYGFSPYDNSVNLEVLKGGSFLTNSLGVAKDLLYLQNGVYFAWVDNIDYGGSAIYSVLNDNQGFINNYAVCDIYTGDNLSFSTESLTNCTVKAYNSGSFEQIRSFMSSVSSSDEFCFNYFGSSTSQQSLYCVSSIEYGKSLCFGNCYVSNSNYYTCSSYPYYWTPGGNTNTSFGFSKDFDSLNSFSFTVSPGVVNNSSTGGNTEISDDTGMEDYNYTEVSDDDLVFYFENNPLYKFNKNVCYVGTNDYNSLLSSVYNSGLVLNIGSGGDIFDLYFDKYGDNFTIKQVGSFINTWSSNYGTIFLTDENDRLFRSVYNGNGTVSQYYDNLTINRFLNNPYVFYNLGQITYNFGVQSTIGEEIATYCYYKLGYDKDSQGLIITDNHDQSYNNNAGNYINNYNRNIYRSGNINIVSQSWAGTPLDYFTGDVNLDFSTFFSKSFNKFKDTFTITNQDLGAGFLPTYIILFLMAIVLFKFISH